MIDGYSIDILPEDWNIVYLKDVGEIVSGGTPDTRNSEFWDGNIPWCTPTDITALNGFRNIERTGRYITISGLNNSSASLLPENSLVVCTRATIGDCAINLVPLATNQGFKNIVPNNQVEVYFLYYLINYLKPVLIKLSSGSTFLEISKKAFENIKLILPPLPEQQKIAEILSTVDEKIEVIEVQIQQTTELKKGLMQQLLTKGIGHTQFKDSPLGEIPESWEVTTSDKIAEITSSKRIHQSDYIDAGIPFYRGKEITQKAKGEKLSDLVYISEKRFDELSYKFGSPKDGDILITAVGTIGTIYLVTQDDKFYFKDGNLMWMRNISNSVDKVFLTYFYSSSLFQTLIENVSSGSSQKALTIIKFKDLPIVIPPMIEQKKIASIVSSIAEKLMILQDKRAYYKELKKGLMQQLLTGKMRVNHLTQNNVAV